MSLRTDIDSQTPQGFAQLGPGFAPEMNGLGWPRGTWFQNRLRYVRELQRRRPAETEFMFENASSSARFPHSNRVY